MAGKLASPSAQARTEDGRASTMLFNPPKMRLRFVLGPGSSSSSLITNAVAADPPARELPPNCAEPDRTVPLLPALRATSPRSFLSRVASSSRVREKKLSNEDPLLLDFCLDFGPIAAP